MNPRNLDWLFSLVLHSSLRACVLIAAILAIQAVAGKRLPARFRYALSLLALLRLLALAVPTSGWSIFNLARTPVLPRPIAIAEPRAVVDAMPASPLPSVVPVPRRWSWESFAAELWLCGGVAFVLAIGWRHRKFSRWIARLPAPEDPCMLELVEQCRAEAGVRRAVKTIIVPRENSAAVFGFIRPRLLLPEGMMDALEHAEARLVVLHELTHVRRRDVLVNWVSVAALAVHWFNPLAWLAARRLRADQELACDAAVLDLIAPSERGSYGRTLLKFTQDFPVARLAAGLVPLITSRHNIKRRIIMITEFKRTGLLARALFAVLIVILGGLTFTRAADDPAPMVMNIGSQPASANVAAAAPGSMPKSTSDYGPEFVKQTSLLSQLKLMKTNDYDGFIQALSVTASDPILNSLIERESENETKLAALRATVDFAFGTPEVRAENAVILEVKQKIKQRADGILAGMSLQANALKAAADESLRSPELQTVVLSKAVEEWAHQRVLAKADYLEYSNFLAHVHESLMNGRDLSGTVALGHQADFKLDDAASRLEAAKMNMIQAQNDYGPNAAAYRTAQKQLQEAREAYAQKTDGVIAAIQTRVNEDKDRVAMIQKEYEEARDRLDQELMREKFRREH